MGHVECFSIGELSRRTGVKVPTIRYYEDVGLMPKPCRTRGQQRRYTSSDADRLGFIRHSRDLGFEVDAIRELLALSVKPDRSCNNADAIASRHVLGIDRRIAKLTALRDVLRRMVDECKHRQVGECRVMQILSDYDHLVHEEHDRVE